jgi:hypothetical protein
MRKSLKNIFRTFFAVGFSKFYAWTKIKFRGEEKRYGRGGRETFDSK